MTPSAYESAVLLRAWEAARNQGHAAVAAIERLEASEPADRWRALDHWQGCDLPDAILAHLAEIVVQNMSRNTPVTEFRFRNQDRHANVTVTPQGHTYLESATLDDRPTANASRGLTRRYGDRAVAVWLKSGNARMMALTNEPIAPKVELSGGDLQLTMRDALTLEPAHTLCGRSGTINGWRRCLAESIGRLAAQLGVPEFREEIPPMLLARKRMPAGASWMAAMMRSGERLLNRLNVTPRGYLYLAIQYEHAEYQNGEFRLLTGRKKSRRSNEPDSATSRHGQRQVMRVTTRDENGLVTCQTLQAGSRVSKRASEWLRESGLFPTSWNRISPDNTDGAVQRGETNPPYFHGI